MILFIIILHLTQLHWGACHKYPIKPNDWGMTTPEMIRNHGYPVEIHHITTEDGYILEYHRVPYGIKNKNSTKKRPPIIVMHGLTFCSVQDFAQGPEKSFGYILADGGYDVWAANMRGNHYSAKHKYLDQKRDMKKFYDFTFHDVGYYDVPAAIDYILNVTNEEKLFYYGNSLGGSTFLTFATTRPDYVKKIRLALLMSPAGYMTHRNYAASLINMYIGRVWSYMKKQDMYYIDGSQLRKSWKELISPFMLNITTTLFATILLSDEDAVAMQPTYGAWLANIPSEAPLKTLVHYAQIITTGNFQQYDYGAKRNFKKYGSAVPPKYNISNIVCPVALYYAKYDLIVPYNQQLRLKKELPNLVYDYVETSGKYNHMSFGAAKDCADKIWKKAIKVLDKY